MTRPIHCKAILAGATALAMLLAAGPALADVKDGVDAWSRGDYEAALREWRGSAEQGDPDALFNMAQAYKLGRGVKQDLIKAEELFAQAAGRGHLQAADNYGLLLFQRGEHARALPFIVAASGRGEPRAQYLLGLSHFNGDGVPKDWVKAYALVSLAHQAGVPQAAPALAEMDKYVPLEQRQQSVSLASSLAANAAASRTRQFTAADLAANLNADLNASASEAGSMPHVAAVVSEMPVQPAGSSSKANPITAGPITAGADYARARPTVTTAAPAIPAKPAQAPAPSSPASGPWRVQLGAFGVPGNAEALWKRVHGRPELSGHKPQFVRAGKLTLLQAGGFASREQAQTACKNLSAAGFDCVTGRN